MKRLAAIATVVASVAIAPARADDGALGLQIPDHWRPLPELVRAETTDGPIAVLSRKAWGDPVGGVFFVAQVVETAKKGSANKLRDALLAQLEVARLEIDGTATSADDPLALTFSSPSGFTGAVVASTSSLPKGKLRLRSVACFYNQREPEISEQLCKVLLTQFSASL